MPKAFINKDIISWALLRAGMSEDELADKLKVREDKVMSWVLGDDHPTFTQAQKMATILGIPFGYLYLNQPPEEELPITDFRTVGSVPQALDVNTKNFLKDVLYKHDWFKEYRIQQGYDAVPFVGRASLEMPAQSVAADIIASLGLHPRPRTGTFEDYIKFLVQKAEDAGIWVMRTSMVGNNTSRPLSTDIFRGVAISDPIVPLIIINSKDSKSAQIFTIAHELAHLWLGETGISNVDLAKANASINSKVEAFCNRVAAELLTPSDEFKSRWNDDVALIDQVDTLAYAFKVSRVVVARRALDLRYITAGMYSEFYQQEQTRWIALAEKQSKKPAHIPQHVMLPIRYGRKFTYSVVSEAVRGSMLLREASSLLGTNPSKMQRLYNKLQA